MAVSQVVRYGLSPKIGPLSFNTEESNQLYRPYSEKTANLIDDEVEAIVSSSYDRALALLTENKAKLTALAETLLDKEVIGTDDLTRVLGEPPFKKSVEYDEFINAAWKPQLPAEPAAEPAERESGDGDGEPAVACK